MAAKPNPHHFIRSVGKRIAEIRREKGLTQKDVADQLGVTIPWVSRVERVGENLQVETMVKIAWALGVHPRELWVAPQSTRKAKRGRPKKT